MDQVLRRLLNEQEWKDTTVFDIFEKIIIIRHLETHFSSCFVDT